MDDKKTVTKPVMSRYINEKNYIICVSLLTVLL